jgi:hypothetical protein
MQGKFWEYHDELFKNQPNFSDEDLAKYAENIGLDVEKFKSDYASQTTAEKVQEDNDMANALRLNSTPSFYVVYDGKSERVNITSATSLDEKVKSILGEPTNKPEEITDSTPEVDPEEIGKAYSAAVTDLLTTLNKPETERTNIKTLDIQKQDWTDASLGCPKPGASYAQVITPGYLIKMEYEGKQYEYHTDNSGNVVDCTK